MVCLDRLRLVLRPLLVAGLLCVGGTPREARAADGDAAGAEAGAAATRELEIGSAPRDPAAPAPWIPGGRGLPTVGNGVGLPDAAGAGPGTDKRRARADRRVARFDFEETNDVGVKLGRGVPLPPGWYAVGRPPQSSDANFARLPLHADLTGRTGFPPYNPVGYSQVGRGRGAAGAGNDPDGYALHLGLRGGNSAAFVQVGRLPVVPGTRYRVTAAVRTAGLEHAAARVVGFYVDAQGNRLGESVRKTARTQTRGAWREVELVLDGTAPRAAYLGLQVELVQPVADELNPLGEHQVVRTDVAGDAWFDDLEVVQLPQVRVVSDSPVGVVRSSSAPGWTVSVRDLRGERLVAQLSLYDADARRVAYDERPLDWGAAARWRWAPPLPGYGYYRAVLRIAYGSSAQGGAAAAPAVARDSHAVLWLPPAGPLAGGTAADDLKRFALLAEDVGPATLDNLPELVSALGLQTAVVSALARDTAGAAIHERVEVVGRYLDRAESSGLRTEVSLHPLPDELHAGSGPGATLAAVLGGAADRWLGYLQPIVARDGARVAAWHLGGADTGAAAEATAITAPRLAGLTERLRHWTPEPRLVVPGAITGVRPAAAAPGTGVGWQALWPAGLTAASVWELSWAAGGPERGAHRRWVLGLPGPDELSHPQRAAEAAQRVVAAWEQQATAVALDKPWAAESDGGLTRLTPDPVAGVVAQAARRLAGFRAAGRLPLPDGLQAVIFRPADAFGDGGGGAPSAGETGVLVAWNQRARAERAFIEVAWGPDVRAVDVWGNPAALAQAEPEPEAGPEPADGAPRRVRVPLGDTPVFVTGVDARMLAFRAGFGIDQPFFPARQTPHARTLSLTNPWPVAISGSLTFAGPAGWEALPRQLNFSIPAGATATYPVTLRFPVSAQAGPDLLTVRARFTARGRHDVHLSTPVELGLPGLGFDPQLMVERVPGVDGAPDRLRAVVNCVMANRGTAPVSLGVFATLPGHPRQERLIPRLGPGEAVRRRFVFDDAAAALRAFDVSLGLRENGGAGVLNARVGVERRGAAE